MWLRRSWSTTTTLLPRRTVFSLYTMNGVWHSVGPRPISSWSGWKEEVDGKKGWIQITAGTHGARGGWIGTHHYLQVHIVSLCYSSVWTLSVMCAYVCTWTMRYEAKHLYFAQSMGNFINIIFLYFSDQTRTSAESVLWKHNFTIDRSSISHYRTRYVI